MSYFDKPGFHGTLIYLPTAALLIKTSYFFPILISGLETATRDIMVYIFIMTGPKTLLYPHLIFRRQRLRVRVDETLSPGSARSCALTPRNNPVSKCVAPVLS